MFAALACASVGAPGNAAEPGSTSDPLRVDRGWATGTVQEQLDRDPTTIPFGKAAIFVPAMTNPLDEPPVGVFEGDRPVTEGTTGARIIVRPGTYDLHIGSSVDVDPMHVRVVAREGHTVVVPVQWSGLVVHVTDERFTSLRTSYELIRADDRVYVGLGFGTDEQAGEPVSTWIVTPGLYKIVRVGETYRARRDFLTVRLRRGRLTHVRLVVDEETGAFVGGGEVPESEVALGGQGFWTNVILGGDASMNHRSNVPGLPEGINFSVRAFADARLFWDIRGSPLTAQLQVEEGLQKSADLPLTKSTDRIKVDTLYVFQAKNWIGPYARGGAESNLLNGFVHFASPTDIVVLDEAGQTLETRPGITALRVSPPLGLNLLKEGAGINIRAFKTFTGEMTLRSGFGARHRVARDILEQKPNETGVFQRIGSTHQAGLEGTVSAILRLTNWAAFNVEVDSLLPFEGPKAFVVELESSLVFKITSYLSVNYVLRFRRDRGLSERDTLDQDVRLRFSVEVL